MGNIVTTLLFAAAICTLSACAMRPELAKIDSSAVEKPINTPEAAKELKAKYEK